MLHGDLTETANAHMQRYRTGAVGPLTAQALVDAFGKIAVLDHAVAATMRAEVEHIVQSQEELLATFEAGRRERARPGTVHYADPSIEIACAALLNNVPTYHVESDVTINAKSRIGAESKRTPASCRHQPLRSP